MAPSILPRWLHAPLHPYVLTLKQTLTKFDRLDALEGAIHESIHRDRIFKLVDWHITSADAFFAYARHLLTSWIPSEDRDGRFVYTVLTTFYYIFEKAQLQDLQTPIHPSSILPSHQPALTPISAWVCGFAARMGAWLDTPASITRQSYASFVACPKYRMQDYRHPDPAHPTGGFRCFNELFSRRLRSPYPYSDIRPIAGLDDPNIVVFPADSTFDGAWPIDDSNHVTITSSPSAKHETTAKHIDSKGLKWPIATLLAGSPHAPRFAGGTWAHAFLNTFDYHRLHAPVAGTVVEARNIQGLCMLQVVVEASSSAPASHTQSNSTGGHASAKLHLQPAPTSTPTPHRRFSQPTHTYHSADALLQQDQQQPTAPNDAGYQFLQTRGLVVIDTGRPDVGLVAVLPMGMASVSSVKLSVKVGDVVRKGEEIAWFEFGGSDIVVVFERGSGVGGWVGGGAEGSAQEEDGHRFMGQEMARLGVAGKPAVCVDVSRGDGGQQGEDTLLAHSDGHEGDQEAEAEIKEEGGEEHSRCYEYFDHEYSMLVSPAPDDGGVTAFADEKVPATVVAVQEVFV